MKPRPIPCAALLLAALLGACSDEPASADGREPAARQEHGAAGAVPGSYEDWCAEHAVPESKCTRCDPALIAAFKATDDWCAEHGLPESQCLACNPGLVIERPPPSGGGR